MSWTVPVVMNQPPELKPRKPRKNQVKPQVQGQAIGNGGYLNRKSPQARPSEARREENQSRGGLKKPKGKPGQEETQLKEAHLRTQDQTLKRVQEKLMYIAYLAS